MLIFFRLWRKFFFGGIWKAVLKIAFVKSCQKNLTCNVSLHQYFHGSHLEPWKLKLKWSLDFSGNGSETLPQRWFNHTNKRMGQQSIEKCQIS